MFGQVTLRTKFFIGIALACAAYVVMNPDSSQTVEPARGPSDAPGTHAVHTSPARHQSPIRVASFDRSDRVAGDAAASSLFSALSWYVAPPAPPRAPVVVQAPPPPTAPPLPFAFMGSLRPYGAAATYFLTAGDRVYDVKIGDTLDSTYSVDGVKSGQLLLTYMPLKIQQSIAVGDE
ncbi:MAG: hypothetical protein QOD56_3149 [Gammaproteobacteria bacterium]|nr:hypothetical protein [Gammaproteobacteria bacterium]